MELEQQKQLINEFTKLIQFFKGHPEFPDLLVQMLAVHSKKSHDYASDTSPFANIELCERGGFPAYKGVIIRMGDKYSRLLNALSEKLMHNESVEDTFIDMAVYSLIGLIEYRKHKGNELTK